MTGQSLNDTDPQRVLKQIGATVPRGSDGCLNDTDPQEGTETFTNRWWRCRHWTSVLTTPTRKRVLKQVTVKGLPRGPRLEVLTTPTRKRVLKLAAQGLMACRRLNDTDPQEGTENFQRVNGRITSCLNDTDPQEGTETKLILSCPRSDES